MYAYIKGKLVFSSPLYAILEACGLGYKIWIPANLFGELNRIGEEAFLFLSFIVREQAHTLYGFKTAEERDFFEILTNVNGIGPKSALNLIGHLSFENLLSAIRQEDDKSLCKVPGIGKKTAERLLLEIKDKVMDFDKSKNIASRYGIHNKAFSENFIASDALSALVNLGYKEIAAEKAIQKVLAQKEADLDLASLITLSLKYI